MNEPLPASRLRPVTVAIDGPSGAGKGTVGKVLAERLGYRFVDTGAMYRAVALAALRQGVSWEDADALGHLARRINLRVEPGYPPRLFLDGEDVSRTIRAEEIGNGASVVSQVASVREGLVALQRRWGGEGGVVMDGRDIGTVVFPFAEVKVFLTASDACRVARRLEQLRARGEDPSPALVHQELLERDRRDTTRVASPLRKAPDALEVDTSDLSITEVVDHLVEVVRHAERAAATRPEKG